MPVRAGGRGAGPVVLRPLEADARAVPGRRRRRAAADGGDRRRGAARAGSAIAQTGVRLAAGPAGPQRLRRLQRCDGRPRPDGTGRRRDAPRRTAPRDQRRRRKARGHLHDTGVAPRDGGRRRGPALEPDRRLRVLARCRRLPSDARRRPTARARSTALAAAGSRLRRIARRRQRVLSGPATVAVAPGPGRDARRRRADPPPPGCASRDGCSRLTERCGAACATTAAGAGTEIGVRSRASSRPGRPARA